MSKPLKPTLKKLAQSPVGEIFLRLRAIYQVLDKRGRQALIVFQVNQTLMRLIGTVAIGGLAGFLIILSKPQIITDNRYLAAVYGFFGFEDQSHFLVLVSGLLVLFIIVQQVLSVFLHLLNIRLTESLTRRSTVLLYRYYLSEDYESRIKRGTTDMIWKGVSAGKQIIKQEAGRASNFLSSVVNAVFIIGVLFAVHPEAVSLLLLITTIFYVSFYLIHKKKLLLTGKQMFERGAQEVKMIKEGGGGAVEIKMMGKEQDFIKEIDRVLVTGMQGRIKQAVIGSIPAPSVKIAGMIVLYIVSVYVFLNDDPEKSFTTLALFAAGAFRMLPSMSSIFSTFLNQKGSAYKYTSVIKDLRAAKRYADEQSGRSERFELVRVKNGIVFDNVSYSYPGAPGPAVSNLNFSLPANKIIALFGRSGAGKSTIIRLLSGILSPQNGRVLVNGKSLQDDEVFKRNWQRSAGVSFQKPFFMDASVAMNVAFEATKEKVDYERVRRALRAAQLDDFIASLPDGLETKVEEDAEILSGGQRQRLAIARALYRESSVLILDEATNALDLVVEKKIVQSLTRMRTGRMIIIIAHRPDTMRFADIVLVLKNDGSLAQGAYNELIEKDHDFRALAGAPDLLAS